MHFRNLRSKAKLVQETEKVSKQLEVRQNYPKGIFTRSLLFFVAYQGQSNIEILRKIHCENGINGPCNWFSWIEYYQST